MEKSKPGLWIFLLLLAGLPLAAQDERSQVPPFLRNSYLEVNIGYIQYPFGRQHLEPGFTMRSVSIPHTAVRLIFFSHQFNRYLSLQLSYMRPVVWVKYDYTVKRPGAVPGPPESPDGPVSVLDTVGPDYLDNDGSVWMNLAGLSLKLRIPIKDRFTIFGEAGACLVTRGGFMDFYTREWVIRDANYLSFLLGVGIRYDLNKKWALQVGAVYSPPDKKVNQPYTAFYSAGFTYTLLPVPEKQIEKDDRLGYIHPRQMVQIGYTTNVFGYGVNDLLGEKLFIFWGGLVEVTNGFSVNYQRNIFHTPRVFSLDWGANLSYMTSRKMQEHFFAVSLFPVLRFTVLHTNPVDLYLFYVIAGPTFLSKTVIDGIKTGKNFTFYDDVGMGIFFGEKRQFNSEIKIAHYSNGNIFTSNPGIKIPLTFSLGYTF